MDYSFLRVVKNILLLKYLKVVIVILFFCLLIIILLNLLLYLLCVAQNLCVLPLITAALRHQQNKTAEKLYNVWFIVYSEGLEL